MPCPHNISITLCFTPYSGDVKAMQIPRETNVLEFAPSKSRLKLLVFRERPSLLTDRPIFVCLFVT